MRAGWRASPSRPASAPDRKAHATARARSRAVAGHVILPFRVQMLARPGDGDPVAHLRRAGIEPLGRDRAQCVRVLGAERVEQKAVELLVHGEMAQAARAQDADAARALEGAHGSGDGAAQIVAAPRARLVGREVRVERDGNDGNDRVLAHEALVHEAEGVSLAVRLRELSGKAHVEVAIHQALDDVAREPGRHGELARLVGHVILRARAPPPLRRLSGMLSGLLTMVSPA